MTAAPAPAGQKPPDPTVLPPITADEVRRMSDGNLVNAMRRWSSEGWQPQPDGRMRGGATSFAQVITAVSSEDPSRFTAVLETLPSDINPLYTTHILLGLRQSATPEQSLRAAWAARAQLSMSAVQIGQLIERVAPHVNAALLDAARVTEPELLELLRRLLDQPPPVLADTGQPGDGSDGEEPEQSEVPEITGEKIADQLLSRTLNRPEYPALRALALLAPAFPQAAALLATELSRLAGSPALAVRALVIELSLTQFNADPGAVAALLAKALDSGGTAADTSPEPLPADPRLLLASSQLRNLLLRLCWARYDIAEPVVARMIAFLYQGEISGTVLERAERFFELHHSQARDLRGNGGHAASILGRLIIGIYARETRNPALAGRTLNLIDAMVLARSYGLEDQLALLDR